MASQYITFLLVFALGLSMVVVVNNIFTGLTDEMRDSVADPTIDEMLKDLKSRIIDSYLLVKNGEEGDRVSLSLSGLPSMLGGQYPYTVTSYVLGDQYYLELVMDKFSTEYSVTESVGLLAGDSVTLSVGLNSISSTHYLIAVKTSDGIEINLYD